MIDEEPEDQILVDNHVIPRNSSILKDRHAAVKISDNRRPVYAVLSEPIRGSIRNQKDSS